MIQRRSELAALLIVSFAIAIAPLHAAEVRLPARSMMTSETAAGPTIPVAIANGGRYVLLRSGAPNLVGGQVDANGADDLFLSDRATGGLTLITHAAGQPLRAADHGSRAAAMTPDGEFVLFHSWAKDLVAGVDPASASPDVYLWQRTSGATTLISHLAGQPLAAAGRSRAVALTPDGAFVLFESGAAGLTATPDSNGATDVFLWRRATGSLTLVSVAGGQAANRASAAVAVRADGGEVLFNSTAGNLTAGSPNGGAFLYDLGNQSTSLVSAGAEARAMTPDGRHLLFQQGDDVLRRDRQTSTTEVLSSSGRAVGIAADGSRILYDSDGQARLWRQGSPTTVCLSCSAGGQGEALSADGRIAAFGNYGDTDYHIYLYDDAGGAFELLTRWVDGEPAPGGGGFPVLSADGRFFAYSSRAQADSGDRNGNFDTFFVERGELVAELQSTGAWPGPIATTPGVGSAGKAFSADGDEVLFSGSAALTGSPAADSDGAAWSYRISDGTLRLLSPLPGHPAVPASGGADPLALARDGRALLLSASPDLLPGGGAGFGPAQLYVYSPDSLSYRLVTERAGEPGQGTAGIIDQVFSDPGLTRVLFGIGGADLIRDGQWAPGLQLYTCGAAGGGCALLSAAHDDPHRGGNAGIVQLAASRDIATAVFGSMATNLVAAGPSGGQVNTFVWRQGAGIELISHAIGDRASEANAETYPNGVSADGRFILASSRATDLAATILDGNENSDVFVFDSLTGTWELVSSTALFPGTTAAGGSHGLAISSNGRFVLFYSAATDLVPGQVDDPPGPVYSFEGPLDLFLLDRATGIKSLISHRPGESLVATGNAFWGCLSEDGSRVAYADYVHSEEIGYSGYPTGLSFWDVDDGETRQILQASGGTFLWPGLWPSCNGYLFDGRQVLVQSFDGTLAPGDTNGWSDAFVVLLDSLFRDGFESGDTGAWSETTQ